MISAGVDAPSSDLGLAEGCLGSGVDTMHYEFAWVDPRARGRRVRGLGDFRDVRRQLRLVWSR